MTPDYRKELVRDEDARAALDRAVGLSGIWWFGPMDHLLMMCPWLRWDRNPMPRFRLFRWLP